MTNQELQALLDVFPNVKAEDVITDKDEQNRLIKQLLIDSKVLSPEAFLFSSSMAKPVTLYFPRSTKKLLEFHSKEQIQVLDVLYALMAKRRFLLVVEAATEDMKEIITEQGIEAEAALAVFADDYNSLDNTSKKEIRIIDPMVFVQKELN